MYLGVITTPRLGDFIKSYYSEVRRPCCSLLLSFFDLCLNPHYVELDTRRRKGRVDYDCGGGGDLMKQDGIGSHALPTSRQLGLAPTHDDVNALHAVWFVGDTLQETAYFL